MDQVTPDKKPWIQRTAEELAKLEDRLTPGAVEAALEAAGELKAIRLKILLGRCYEILRESNEREEQAGMDNDFLEVVKREIE